MGLRCFGLRTWAKKILRGPTRNGDHDLEISMQLHHFYIFSPKTSDGPQNQDLKLCEVKQSPFFF